MFVFVVVFDWCVFRIEPLGEEKPSLFVMNKFVGRSLLVVVGLMIRSGA